MNWIKSGILTLIIGLSICLSFISLAQKTANGPVGADKEKVRKERSDGKSKNQKSKEESKGKLGPQRAMGSDGEYDGKHEERERRIREHLARQGHWHSSWETLPKREFWELRRLYEEAKRDRKPTGPYATIRDVRVVDTLWSRSEQNPKKSGVMVFYKFKVFNIKGKGYEYAVTFYKFKDGKREYLKKEPSSFDLYDYWKNGRLEVSFASWNCQESDTPGYAAQNFIPYEEIYKCAQPGDTVYADVNVNMKGDDGWKPMEYRLKPGCPSFIVKKY